MPILLDNSLHEPTRVAFRNKFCIAFAHLLSFELPDWMVQCHVIPLHLAMIRKNLNQTFTYMLVSFILGINFLV